MTVEHAKRFMTRKEEDVILNVFIDGSNAFNKKYMRTFSFPLITIRDTEGNITCTIQVEPSLSHYNADNAADCHMYFKSIKSDSKYIYALYSPSEQSQKDCILVFSWSGEAVAKYSILPAMDFAVDGVARCFVAIDDETGMCVEYKY